MSTILPTDTVLFAHPWRDYTICRTSEGGYVAYLHGTRMPTVWLKVLPAVFDAEPTAETLDEFSWDALEWLTSAQCPVATCAY